MQSAKWIFRIAGTYGVVVLLPMYFLEHMFTDSAHPEFYYGFIGIGLAWQVLFFLLATDPIRYRLMMIPAILEKLAYGVATFGLYLAGRAEASVPLSGAVDWFFAALFLWAWLTTAEPARALPAAAE
jgi:hypothetical protein